MKVVSMAAEDSGNGLATALCRWAVDSNTRPAQSRNVLKAGRRWSPSEPVVRSFEGAGSQSMQTSTDAVRYDPSRSTLSQTGAEGCLNERPRSVEALRGPARILQTQRASRAKGSGRREVSIG